MDIDDDKRAEAARAVVAGTLNLARRLRAERPPGTLSPGRLAILGYLRRTGGASPGEVAAAHRIQPQSVTRILAGLEEAGLVQRSPCPGDGRKVVLQLTPAGRAALTDGVHHGEDWVDHAMAATLTPAEIQLLAIAGRLLNNIADWS